MRPNARQLDNGYCYLFTMSQLEVRPVIGTFERQAPADTLLDRFSKGDDSPLRLTLLLNDVNSSIDNRVHSAEKKAMDGPEMGITSTGIKRNHGLTPSEKKTFVAKRLILG